MRHWLLSCGVLAALFQPTPAAAQALADQVDQGNYVISVGERAVGTENFTIEASADSVYCMARSYLTRRTPEGDQIVEKTMGWSANRSDWSLRYYQSNETFRGATLVRGVVQLSGDTALTVFVENKDGGGVANRRVAPPGRVFILDSGIYSLFNLICLNLHERTFTTRPLNLLAVGPPDSLLEAQATDLGHETIRWGSRPVQARKIQISDGSITFIAWMSPDRGRMLRLTHEASGLRIDREAPAVKKRSAPPKPGG
jgi:hypothetical protein